MHQLYFIFNLQTKQVHACRMLIYSVHIIYGVLNVTELRFYVLLKNFSLIWRRHHCRWRTFEQGGFFIVPHLLWHGTSVFPVSSEGPPHIQSPLTTQEGMWRIYSNTDLFHTMSTPPPNRNYFDQVYVNYRALSDCSSTNTVKGILFFYVFHC
jgi:hypothetical protein